MHMVESQLVLTMQPVSIKEFNQIKNLSVDKEYLDQASLYIIAQREVPQMTVDFEHSNHEKVVLNVKLLQADKSIELMILLPENLSLDAFIKNIHNISLEQILYYAAHNFIKVLFKGDITPFISYGVMYVGECVEERLTKRFRAHHALQNMLIEEKTISPKHCNSEELILMPFRSDSQIVSCLTPDCSEEDFIKSFTNDFSFGNKEVILDCEKALVHGMNPKYNKILFKNYPLSKDGLFNTEAEVYSYSISENIILKYKDGVVYGCADDLYASKIVGDKQGYTHIYKPGEDFTQRYVDQWGRR